MRNNFLLCGALCLVAFSSGCNSSDGAGSTAPQGPQNDPPAKSPAEALQRLSAGNRKAFETWKNQLVKSCDGTEAFGLSRTSAGLGQVGMDLAVFLEKNDHSLVFKGTNGEIAVLDNPRAISGEATSKIEETETIDGQTYRLRADLRREGYKCTVNLYGQKVHESTIASSFDVVGYWSPKRKIKPIEARYVLKVRPFDSFGLTEVSNHSILDAIAENFQPNDDAIQLIASQLQMPINTAKQVISLNLDEGFRGSLKLANESNSKTLWFNRSNETLVVSTDRTKKIFGGASQSTDFEWKMTIPEVSVSGLKNTRDKGNLKFLLSLAIFPSQNRSDLYTYLLSSVQGGETVPYDGSEASECVRSRFTVLKSLHASETPNSIVPGVDETFGPCDTLSDDLESQLYASGTLKGLVPSVFLGVIPSAQMKYNGWNGVLSKLSFDLLEQDKNIVSELDPAGTIPVVASVAHYLTQIKNELQKSTQLLPIKTALLQMGLNWAYTGQRVDSSRIVQIVHTIDRVVNPFKVSADTLLGDLAQDANKNEDVLKFAESIDESYKAEANRALVLADSLNFKTWETDCYNQILQRKMSLGDLQNWSSRFQRIQTELSKYSMLGSLKNRLTEATIKWLNGGEIELGNIGTIYSALDNSIEPFRDSTLRLMDSLSDSLTKNKAAVEFARGITQEYKQLAISVRDTADAVGMQDWEKSILGSVLQNMPAQSQFLAWNITLQAALRFTQREQNRLSGGDDPFAGDHRKTIISTSVKEGWTEEDFASLEQITDFGRFKTACERNATSSSVADCVGISLFSKSSKKFLDPQFKRRYGPLSAAFLGYLGRLQPEFNYFSMRTELENTFFSFKPIWVSCDEGRFQTKASTLSSQVATLTGEPDQLKRWELERAIRQTLEDCN